MSLHHVETAIGAELQVDGRRVVNFAGSSYLGLSGNREIAAAGCAALGHYGAGYQFPRAHGMLPRLVAEAEQGAADFFDMPTALVLPGGYYFGLMALAAARQTYAAVFYDAQAHHALRDGIAASGLPAWPYAHLDAEDLARQLRAHAPPRRRPLIVTDGLYATLGRLAPLAALMAAGASYDAGLIVDESHSFGVLGATGRGAVEAAGIDRSRVMIGGSTGKAFGVAGGLIPTDAAGLARLRDTPCGRGAAIGSPATSAMIACSLAYIRSHPEIRARLAENVGILKAGLRALGLEVGDSPAPVAAFRLDSAKAMAQLRRRLFEAGLFVFHSTYIGAGTDGVIRISIFADHRPAHFDQLLDALRRWL